MVPISKKKNDDELTNFVNAVSDDDYLKSGKELVYNNIRILGQM
jgi:hypothetical protein